MRLHHVFANRSNIGDWLSAQGIQALLHEHVVDLEVVEHMCDGPFVADTLARLETAPVSEPIVIGGGGLFMDYFDPWWRGFERIAAGRTFALWGVGLVDLKQEASRPDLDLVRRIVARSQLTVVRDELTREALGLPLPGPVPCPSLAAIERPAAPGWGILHVNNYTTVGAEAYDTMRAIGQAHAADTGRPFRETNNRIEAGRTGELDAVLERYRQSDLVLSSALHGCVIAVAMGWPVLAVSGDRKIEAFMASVGLGDWVIGQDELDRIALLLTSLDRQPASDSAAATAVQANRRLAAEIAAAFSAAPAAVR